MGKAGVALHQKSLFQSVLHNQKNKNKQTTSLQSFVFKDQGVKADTRSHYPPVVGLCSVSWMAGCVVLLFKLSSKKHLQSQPACQEGGGDT